MTIIGDVVRQVGGSAIDLQVLLPVGADPHSYQATPGDLAQVAQADVIFLNGAGYELFMDDLIQNAGDRVRIVPLSDEISLRALEDPFGQEESEPGGESGEPDGDDHTGDLDPHVWFDPNLVILWVQQIAAVLSEIDNPNAAYFNANAQAYIEELTALDAWIVSRVAEVPEANRLLVQEHLILGYFAARYGFTQVGAVIPSYSTLAEPSARQIAALVDTINALGVKAIFVGQTIAPGLAERVAEETGTKIFFLYTESLSEAGGAAASYMEFMRSNVSTITQALK
ncbi:MAG: metal ABC transporter substrate-binding protein [Anaerolineaceae bacterium]|nr:metal ABC transporter substrate-binding protein [Anaerolineaceae bacterium]